MKQHYPQKRYNRIDFTKQHNSPAPANHENSINNTGRSQEAYHAGRYKIIFLALLMLFVISCAGTTNQERKTQEGAVIGAGVGAILGQVIGGDTEATLIGAGIGAALGGIAGNQIGAYMDRQEAELRNAIASSQAASQAASVTRSQNVLTATFKSSMFFDYNSDILKPGAYPELDRVSRVLTDFPQTRIRVEGHTDTQGSAEYNQQLSEQRAQAVANALIQRGVDPMRMEIIGFGESQPISSSDADNRRVNIVIIPIQA
ncbi:OmpF [Desulfamplus magnetovallimortis]|uniref:OmpF n=1 Tax=Desulfamplus magnetovallimortis TaxID=1246637 RepID=A0A1W1H5L0_9BACT|nr:OmpA family protein [Desulfamplus magnetovallimortis]SLM27648.1 OmpF [Desulfamplus magnetovallimortis]